MCIETGFVFVYLIANTLWAKTQIQKDKYTFEDILSSATLQRKMSSQLTAPNVVFVLGLAYSKVFSSRLEWCCCYTQLFVKARTQRLSKRFSISAMILERVQTRAAKWRLHEIDKTMYNLCAAYNWKHLVRGFPTLPCGGDLMPTAYAQPMYSI